MTTSAITFRDARNRKVRQHRWLTESVHYHHRSQSLVSGLPTSTPPVELNLAVQLGVARPLRGIHPCLNG